MITRSSEDINDRIWPSNSCKAGNPSAALRVEWEYLSFSVRVPRNPWTALRVEWEYLSFSVRVPSEIVYWCQAITLSRLLSVAMSWCKAGNPSAALRVEWEYLSFSVRVPRNPWTALRVQWEYLSFSVCVPSEIVYWCQAIILSRLLSVAMSYTHFFLCYVFRGIIGHCHQARIKQRN
ncbi:hypothetical protein BCR42DRAFT_475288 [Absidia repens]|uniref:Uncharacterized protein n=1 Tax=Absidia repens TaxID=90262 RepID=A0A1X2HX96_9FUNG|nr:hypothetical protein BCR42DRAFT_475288 [Absidia repens]